MAFSQSSARDVAEVFGVSAADISVISHGIDTDYGVAHAEDAPTEKVERVRPGEYILYIGNIEPRKNLDALLDAYARLKRRNAGLPPLVLAGRPAWNYKHVLKKIEQAGPSVLWLGFVSQAEKIWLLRNCALFVFPSLYEGFGFPVLEALACGAPVLCTEAGS